jgi:hypothetical protein
MKTKTGTQYQEWRRLILASAKNLILRPIDSKTARNLIKKIHYSGKVTQNSQFHIGVYWEGVLEGAMQFGPSLDKKKIIGLVKDTKWNGFLELNRMAFSEKLPRNSESRALAVAMRLIKKHKPGVEWVISFADGTQCGDGTIYRASGFILAGLKVNKTMLRLPDGTIVSDKTLNDNANRKSGWWKKNGAKPLAGYMMRYIYPLNKTVLDRLTVPILPFSDIKKAGAGMYLGQKRATSKDSVVPTVQVGEGGANPTVAL